MGKFAAIIQLKPLKHRKSYEIFQKKKYGKLKKLLKGKQNCKMFIYMHVKLNVNLQEL